MSRSPSTTIADRRDPSAAGKRRGAARFALALAILVATLAAAPANAAFPWRFPYHQGDTVRFQGTVADPQGRPIAGLEIVLEASNPHFDWRRLSRVEGAVTKRTVASSERGEFSIDWTWTATDRKFELVALVRAGTEGREVVQELARLDVTDRVEHGSPVTAALTVQRAGFVERLRDFVGSLRSDDERRVWTDLGLPESVDRRQSPAGTEASWWYFAAGRVAWFRDGRLLQIQQFAPVRPIGGEEGR
jgi:hypothetical protein